MAESRMAEIASMYGKKLGEVFEIWGYYGTRKYKFMTDGLWVTCQDGTSDKMESHVLMGLLAGKYKIIKEASND